MDKQAFLQGCTALGITVSREKMAHIDTYALLLSKWNKKINLIAPSTVGEIYKRHILDSIQIIPEISDDDIVLDIGSGGGLPSLIIAIMTGARVYACERVGKKVQFMREVARKVNIQDRFTVLQEDVYQIDSSQYQFSVISARAFAEMSLIFKAGKPLLREGGKYVLLKGAIVDDELAKCHDIFNVTMEKKKSITSSSGSILIARPVSCEKGRGKDAQICQKSSHSLTKKVE